MLTNLVRSMALIATVLGCAQGSTGAVEGPAGNKVVFTGDQKTDWAQIVALEDQAKALAKTDGCSSADQCRKAAVGSKACGGPRYYLVYCSRTTDSAALFSKLDAIAAAEKEFNTRYQILSTCEFRLPPTVGLVAGSCQADAPQAP